MNTIRLIGVALLSCALADAQTKISAALTAFSRKTVRSLAVIELSWPNHRCERLLDGAPQFQLTDDSVPGGTL
jgi:hypothetical protein